MTDDRGQSLVLLALVLATAAIAIVGLADAQRRIVAGANGDRAGEAAVEAAASVVAEAYVHRAGADVRAVLADPVVLAAARSTATALAQRNAGVAPLDIALRCNGHRVEVTLTLSGRVHRAGFEATECSQH